MDRWNNQANLVPKIHQFNIAPSNDPGNRFLPTSVHNGGAGLSVSGNQATYHPNQMLSQGQQMFILPNGVQNPRTVLSHNPPAPVGYQMNQNQHILPRQPVVTVRTATDIHGHLGQTKVHTNYAIPPMQQPLINMHYGANQNPPMSVHSTGNNSAMLPIMNPSYSRNGQPIPTSRIIDNHNRPNVITTSVSSLPYATIPSQVAGMSAIMAHLQRPITSVILNPVTTQNPAISVPQTTPSTSSTNKVPQNLLLLQQFLKKIVENKDNLSQYFKEGTVENRNLIEILCYNKFRQEFLRLSNNDLLKMQISKRMSRHGVDAFKDSDSMNTVKSKSIQDIFDTLLALTWMRAPQGSVQGQWTKPNPQTQTFENMKSMQMTHQKQTQQLQPSPRPPINPPKTTALPMSASRIKKEPGLAENRVKEACSGTSRNIPPLSKTEKPVTQSSESNKSYPNFEDFLRMSEEAAEPIDNMFESIVNENSLSSTSRDVKPIPINHLASHSQSSNITRESPIQKLQNLTSSASSHTSLSSALQSVPMSMGNLMHQSNHVAQDVKPINHLRTILPKDLDPSENAIGNLQSLIPNSLPQTLQSVPVRYTDNQQEPDTKPVNILQMQSALNPHKTLEHFTEKTTSFVSKDDNYLQSLEELQQTAFASLKAANPHSTFSPTPMPTQTVCAPTPIQTKYIPPPTLIQTMYTPMPTPIQTKCTPEPTPIQTTYPPTPTNIQTTITPTPTIQTTYTPTPTDIQTTITPTPTIQTTYTPKPTTIQTTCTLTPIQTSCTGTPIANPVSVPQVTPLRDKKKGLRRPLSPNNMCRVEAEDQPHICSSLIESNISDKKSKDLIKVKKGEVICSLSSKIKPSLASSMIDGDCSHYWCNFCVYQTNNKSLLVNHVISAHRFSCQYCTFQCYSRADVVEHTISLHRQAINILKDFRYCVLLPDYLKILDKIESVENETFETECYRSFQAKKLRASPRSSESEFESDWEEEFLDDGVTESGSEMSDIDDEDDAMKQKGRKRKKKRSSSSDDDSGKDGKEKEVHGRSVSEAFQELNKQRKAKKSKRNKPDGTNSKEVCADASIDDAGVTNTSDNDTTVMSSVLKIRLSKIKIKKKKNKSKSSQGKLHRPTRRTAGKRSNDGSQSFMQLEAILSGEDNDHESFDDDDKDEDFVPEKIKEKEPGLEKEKEKKKKIHIETSPVQVTKTPMVRLTKYNLLKRCIHCDYSNLETQSLKLHSLDKHSGLFLGIWQDSLDLVLYICPRRFCDFYGSAPNDYLNHLEKCSYDSSEDVVKSLNDTKEYIKYIKEKRIMRPSTISNMRDYLHKYFDGVKFVNASSQGQEKEANSIGAPDNPSDLSTPETTNRNSNSPMENSNHNKRTKESAKMSNNDKEVTEQTGNKDILDKSEALLDPESFYKCAFCSFKALSNPLNVRAHTVKTHPEFPLYTINLKCVEEGRDSRFVLFCVGVNCETILTSSDDYFKHIETCEAIKQLKDDRQLLKTNKFVKTTIHRL